ncbi:hypothetical protein ABI_11990 [Asticcacaulis biprosthecium C19]|uniref:Uncharacterized protein n=1 Tax=Asticcacaulis biprosthecium C19 TaxID=715226 RepID=F4QHM6_9CAUL|nr:hypothetical protein ABI_11990 [Asticcacaulis biprosthecium C19]
MIVLNQQHLGELGSLGYGCHLALSKITERLNGPVKTAAHCAFFY